jgi:hypothetical protein
VTILQLNPSIPMTCHKGDGYAIALVDYSEEHHLYWVIALNETGEIWMLPNPQVRMQKNITMGRFLDKDRLNKMNISCEIPSENMGMCIHDVPENFKCEICKHDHCLNLLESKIKALTEMYKNLSISIAGCMDFKVRQMDENRKVPIKINECLRFTYGNELELYLSLSFIRRLDTENLKKLMYHIKEELIIRQEN